MAVKIVELALGTISCSECRLTYAVQLDWVTARKQDHRTFWCPNGHQQHFPGESDLERLEREKKNALLRCRSAEAQATHARDQQLAAERSARAYKGQATRARRKAVHGVCPAPGCGRTFQDLQRHVAGQHPQYLAEHGPVKGEA